MPSRRQLLQASAFASGLGASGLTAATAQAATSGPVYACVGTYSDGGKP
ncbi:lactonase family protein, partial [Verminephrobacter sp. Larva24]